MTRCFADTSYYIALLNPHDEIHQLALNITAGFNGQVVTTAWVMNELGNYLVKPPNRELFVAMLGDLRSDRRISIVPMSQEMFDRGIALYSERPDKAWSVTDCISFLVMSDFRLVDALTSDHHFEQAGFNVLLK